MSKIEVIAAVERGPTCWSAAIAVISPGKSIIDTTTCDSEQRARFWIGSRAVQLGFEQSDVQYRASSRT